MRYSVVVDGESLWVDDSQVTALEIARQHMRADPSCTRVDIRRSGLGPTDGELLLCLVRPEPGLSEWFERDTELGAAPAGQVSPVAIATRGKPRRVK